MGCGEKDVPGAYAGVADAVCWIHWATNCIHGNKYSNYYDYSSQCQGWFDKEIAATRYLEDLNNNFKNKCNDIPLHIL